MNAYRVLFSDSVNGQTFNFAIIYKAHSLRVVSQLAQDEFPQCAIVSITRDMNL